MKRFTLSLACAAAAVTVLSACVADPASPWEMTLQFERSVSILDRATVAARLVEVDPPEVLLNVQCEGEITEDRTISLPIGVVSQALCGLHFQLGSFAYRGTEATGVDFVVTWGDDAADAPPQVIEEGSGE